MDYQYLGISEIAKSGRYPFTIGQIRHYLTKRHENGLDKAVRKIGKRLYLRLDIFDLWIEAQSSVSKAAREANPAALKKGGSYAAK